MDRQHGKGTRTRVNASIARTPKEARHSARITGPVFFEFPSGLTNRDVVCEAVMVSLRYDSRVVGPMTKNRKNSDRLRFPFSSDDCLCARWRFGLRIEGPTTKKQEHPVGLRFTLSSGDHFYAGLRFGLRVEGPTRLLWSNRFALKVPSKRLETTREFKEERSSYSGNVPCVLGRPRDRSVDSSPSSFAVLAIHSAPPNGWPRFPQRRSASNSDSV